ncbi:hypothetical protein GQ53DRAFT_846499 [Thozetella sp. PMI_491]|nr:hypothetical protein GQ53DRAFT_846499 [Thozetella sp. PMI_491]
MPQPYVSIPLEDDGEVALDSSKSNPLRSSVLRALIFSLGCITSFVLGLGLGQGWPGQTPTQEQRPDLTGLLPPQEFIPDIPSRGATFKFPTKYEDTGPDGDRLWDELMPVGAGFVRVPYPRRFNMPASEPIEDDNEEGELYSLSVTHQLHCLAVLRHVIIKYEKHDKSRFAGDGHEYHCLDYIRQAVLCAGDTTLDYADDQVIGQDGKVTRYGFTGANSTHMCRDWDAIKKFAEEHRSGDRTGVLV